LTNQISPDIISTAEATRKWAEKIGQKEKWPKNLCGLCIRASVRLFTQLRKRGYRPRICAYIKSPRHFYVKVNGHIIDVTATQFQDETVFIRHEQEVKYVAPYSFRNKIEFSDIETVKSFLEISKWEKKERIGI